MTEEEKYAFDVSGYMVVEQAIEPDALSSMNAFIDEQEAKDPLWLQKARSFLTWGPQFRDLLDNERVLPYLRDILGTTLRLDHDYSIFSQQGAPGMGLHGGGCPYDPAQYYHVYDGRIYSGLAVASYALTDILPGKGGFACIPGSHKSRFPVPTEIQHFRKASPLVKQLPMKAGDCVIFTEALTHGTFGWTAPHQRRSLFLKYSPKHMTWASRFYFPTESNTPVMQMEAEFTEAQRSLLHSPNVQKNPERD